jgi:putative ABC transport system permease protein
LDWREIGPGFRRSGNVRFEIVGRGEASDAHSAVASAVDAEAFQMLGVTMVRGRRIEATDRLDAPFVGVVSQSLARRYWPDQDVIGQQLRVVGVAEPVTVVGVVADVRQPLADARIEGVLYLSYLQAPWPFMTVLVEPRGDGRDAALAVREEVAKLSSDQATGSIRTLQEIQTAWLVAPRARASLVGFFGTAAVIVTLIGLFASVRRDVTSRFREFAIRQALGASPASVTSSLAIGALAAPTMGLLAGVAGVVATFSRFESRLPDMAPIEAVRVAAVLVVIGLVAVFSAYIPARGAGTANPAEAPRSE